MHKQDQSTIAVAAKKISEKARMQRRKLRAKRLNKKNEKTVQYQAGSFGLSSEPEDITSVKKYKNKQTKSKVVQNRVELKFVDEKAIPIVAINWFIWAICWFMNVKHYSVAEYVLNHIFLEWF